MYRFTSYIAILLLLLFTRAMVPDALILELHPHTHTVHTDQTDAHKAQVGKKHKHCPVEDLFEAPFQGTVTEIDGAAPVYDSVYVNHYQLSRAATAITYFRLRGPPIV